MSVIVKYAKKKSRRYQMTKYKKKSRRYRRLPSKRTGYLPVKQKQISTVVIPTAIPNGWVERYSFSIQTLDNLPSLTRLFDQYRIKRVTMQFNGQSFNDPTANPSMTCVTSIDLDGGIIPASFETVLQASNAKVSQWGGTGTKNLQKFVSLKPRFANQIIKEIGPPVLYSQTLGNPNAWIDLADGGTTEHHGVVIAWRAPAGVLNFAQAVSIITTYDLEFRKFR